MTEMSGNTIEAKISALVDAAYELGRLEARAELHLSECLNPGCQVCRDFAEVLGE